jgi:hypothetical protein
MDVLFAFLIVLLFSALPTQPYSASGRARYPPKADEGKPQDEPDGATLAVGFSKICSSTCRKQRTELGDNWLTHAREPRMNPPKRIFEAEDGTFEWAQSRFSEKWKSAEAANVNGSAPLR